MRQMRSHIFLCLFTLFLVSVSGAQQSGVDSTGLPGDQFSLQGALQLFKESADIASFEKALNTEDNTVHNLDLNGDGDIDYITVIDKSADESHAFVLRALVAAGESQDIAVIELEKTGPESAVIQIIGDEDVFGEQLILEPAGDDQAASTAFMYSSRNSGPSAASGDYFTGPVVNVWIWPSVRFVYGPVYRPWISPWRWSYYPAGWRPWRPRGWWVWNPIRVRYHHHFVVCGTHRVLKAHRVYTPFRASSVTVRTRHGAMLGNYRVTHKKTTVYGPGGHATTVRKTTVRGPRGGKTTRVRVRRH